MAGKKRNEIIIFCILIVFLAFLFAQTFYFPDVGTWDKRDEFSRYSPSAATWPRIVIFVLFILCLWSLILNIINNKSAPASFLNTIEEHSNFSSKTIHISIIFVTLIFAYLFSIEYLGFPLATFIFGLLTVLVIGQKGKNIWKELIFVAIISSVIIMLFSRFLYLPLPKGIGVFRKFSELVIF